SIFRSKLLETLHMIALQAAKLLAPPVIRKLRSRRSCEPPRQPIFLATAEHRPDAASRRSLRAYASSGAFQRPLQWLNSLLQGGPLFRGQTTDPSDLQSEGSQQTTDLVLVVTQLVDEELPSHQQRAQFLACHRLHMHRFEPARAD